MPSRRRWAAAAVAVAAAIPLACSDDDSSSGDEEPPATVVELGDGANQITLTEAAARRLGIEMGEITEEGGDMIIPYAAVVYDEEGATWTYLSPQPLTFVRTPITVARIADDDRAFLSEGPEVGTEVVIVGQAELFGVEKGIGY
jgi:hypothetical protein